MRLTAVALLVLLISSFGYSQEEMQESPSAVADPSREPAQRVSRTLPRKKRPQIKAPPQPAPNIDEEARSADFASTKAPSSVASHPVNSVFYHPAKGSITVESDLSYGLASSTSVVTNDPLAGQTSYTESETKTLSLDNEIAYGITDRLSLRFGLSYSQATSSEVGYRNTAGTAQALDQDVKNSGISDPSIGAQYRLFAESESDFVVDLASSFQLSAQDAKRGSSYDSNFDNIDDASSSGNAASGGSALVFGVRAGKMLTQEFGGFVVAAVNHQFASESTSIKGGPSSEDLVFNTDAATSFAFGVVGEWRATPEITLSPNFTYGITPKAKTEYIRTGNRVRVQAEGGSVMNLGMDAAYALNTSFALQAGYGYTISSPGDTTAYLNDVLLNTVASTEDSAAHEVSVGVRYIF